MLTAAEAAQAAQAALEAAPPLENASDLIEPLAAGLEGQLPPQAQQAFDEAVGELADAIEQALANNAVLLARIRQQAQNALAQAAAALSLAEQGAQQMAQGQQPVNNRDNNLVNQVSSWSAAWTTTRPKRAQ